MNNDHAVRKSGPWWQVMRLTEGKPGDDHWNDDTRNHVIQRWEFVKSFSTKPAADAFARRANTKGVRL